jgi:hypothetical protein
MKTNSKKPWNRMTIIYLSKKKKRELHKRLKKSAKKL